MINMNVATAETDHMDSDKNFICIWLRNRNRLKHDLMWCSDNLLDHFIIHIYKPPFCEEHRRDYKTMVPSPVNVFVVLST